MARVRDISIDEVSEDLRSVYERFSSEYGPFLNQVKVFAHRPPALKHIMGLLLDLADESLLPKRYLEIALVAVSRLNECTYCVAHHAPRLVDQGLSPATVAGILEPECEGLDETARLVRDFAIEVTMRPQTMRDGIFDRLKLNGNAFNGTIPSEIGSWCGRWLYLNDNLLPTRQKVVVGVRIGMRYDLPSVATRHKTHATTFDI